ncbi:beta-L-arabinofuranosidase domain-containing protein [Cellulomonas sp. ATA003]|uniref:beta-L-arabinofuranosidase domain-containing protein n=1 Tax=Cellulomonas sp. ATA003 TaxID=3073064 RepID=UPI002872F1C7|nr:beta-L-arabinofuranosidase domain-containing protein [Cellulomonas sp. ATA003]WNB84407.1 glycoside hydrolase family 127 protein [Cellulomonas sp. ATA003]
MGTVTVPPAAVRLLAGPFRDAQDADVRYVLALDPDRLLAPYLVEAGLVPDAPGYGNWEGDGMGGHIGGHYLSACAQLWAATGDDRLRDRLEHVLDVLERCQAALGTGYLGGVPAGAALGDELAAGVVDADTFSLNGRWVPLYNLHKTLAGLLDAATYAGSGRAVKMAMAWADWWLSVTRTLSDEAFEDMLHTEFGGMADAFATLSDLTGRAEYLDEAQRFAHRALLDPLVAGRDVLDGLHANTQIAKVVGYARLATLTGDDRYRAAAEHFWQTVTTSRTVAIGGNSAREHFHPVDDFATVVAERQGPETCNTYNMLKLTALLFEASGDPSLLDFYERATLNHVLSSQHPVRGGFVYFTPLRPAHYRVYSQPETSMWCCVGSGMENHARYGQLVFSRPDGDLAVNLYLAAALDPGEGGLRAWLEADLLTSDTAVLRLTVDAPTDLAVRLRRPGWAHAVDVEVDGEPAETVEEGGYVVVRRTWSADHTVTVRLTTGLAVDAAPDGSAWVALRWGPVVLAARDGDDRLDGLRAGPERMGHVAAGPTRPLAATPVVAASDARDAAVLVTRSPLAVDLTVQPDGGAGPTTVRLEPFSQIHDERYTLYWPIGTDVAARRAELAALDRADVPETVVVDEVVAGEQQPESDHAFAGEHTRAGSVHGVHSRSALGWFSYTLRDPAAAGVVLRLTFAEADPGDPRAHEVRVDGTVLGAPVGTRAVGGVVHTDHTLDAVPRADDPEGRVVVSVHGRDGLPTGDLLRVRLLGGAP